MLTKIIKQDLIDHFERWFDRAENIVLVSHVSPDGDAIGSTLGLWHFFNSQGKKATVIVPNNFPEFLKWLPGAREILCYDKRKEQADELIDKAEILPELRMEQQKLLFLIKPYVLQEYFQTSRIVVNQSQM